MRERTDQGRWADHRALPGPEVIRAIADLRVSPASLVLAFGRALGCEHDEVECRLADLSAGVARRHEPHRQAAELCALLEGRLVADPATDQVADLLVPHVLEHGHGHVLACALVAMEVATRVGLACTVVTTPDALLLWSGPVGDQWMIDPADGWSWTDPCDQEPIPITVRCRHQLAASWLDAFLAAAAAPGNRTEWLTALDLYLALPLAGPRRDRLLSLRLRSLQRLP